MLLLVAGLYVLDAARTDFAVDSIQLGLLLGSALLLLGVEGASKLFRGG